MRLEDLKQLLNDIDRNMVSVKDRMHECTNRASALLEKYGAPQMSEEDEWNLIMGIPAQNTQELANKLNAAFVRLHNTTNDQKEYEEMMQKVRGGLNQLTSIVLLKGFLIHISMIDETGKATNKAFTRYKMENVPEKAFENAPKYKALHEASLLSDREYMYIARYCEEDLSKEVLQYYKPGIIYSMTDFIRFFLPDAIPSREREDQDNTNLLAMPSSPSINNVMQILTSKNTKELKEGAKKARNKAKISIGSKTDTDNTTIKCYEFDTDNSNVKIEWKSIVDGTNKGVRKMLILSMIEVMRQAYHQDNNGHGFLSTDTISFPLSKLVENGMYSSLNNARKGFTSALNILMNISFTAKIKSRKRKSNSDTENTEDYITRPFFIGHGIKNNQCTIEINPKAQWDILLRYYTYILPFAFQLKSNAFNLIYSICFLARQNCAYIKKANKFNISMRTIQHKLGLPDETNTSKPTITIIEPIDNAISEIEEHLAKLNTETDYIKITPILPDEYTYKTYLDNGYLEIQIAGKYAERFTAIADNKDKAIASKVRIQEKAQRDALKEIYKENMKKKEQETKEQSNQEQATQEQVAQEQTTQEQANQ